MKRFFKLIKYLLIFTFILTIILANLSIDWALDNYSNLTVEEIIFTITTNVGKTESSILNGFREDVIIPAFINSLVFSFIIYILSNYILNNNIIIRLKVFQKSFSIRIKKVFLKLIITVIVISISFTSTYKSFKEIGLIDYMKYTSSDSKFIEKNYVDTRKVNIKFPKKKKNLIYIYVESLESTFFSKNLGGSSEYNLMEGIIPLSNSNINFSNSNKQGGASVFFGTGWTSAAMVAQSAAIPVKMNLDVNTIDMKSYLKGAYTIGEVLKENGYNNYLMIGSDAKFGNRELFFRTHGDYQIYDYNTAKEDKIIADDYYVWWGYEDSILFDYAKLKLQEISSEDKPFNFTILTSNMHFPDGYLESDCPQKYDKKLSNVISCNIEDLSKFIYWIQKQDFYKNTTIVIVGDHLHMNNKYFKDIKDSNRKVYNLFINSSIKAKNSKNRKFSTLDMFPTTIGSLGAKIEGEQLGLGVNLFSTKQTLLEKYGYAYMNNELAKNSKFYKNKFIKE